MALDSSERTTLINYHPRRAEMIRDEPMNVRRLSRGGLEREVELIDVAGVAVGRVTVCHDPQHVRARSELHSCFG